MLRICDIPTPELRRRLRRDGIAWRVGPFVARLRTSVPVVCRGFRFLYRDFPIADSRNILDFDLAVRARRPLSWWVDIFDDGRKQNRRVPRSRVVPLLEWALNLGMFHRPHRFCMVHAAVVERDDAAVLFPGAAGSGKSTLCAALVHRGWRLFSDEVALIRPSDGQLIPVPRPIGLKEQSIAVIRAFAPEAMLGPSWRGTAKGTVAHVRPPIDSVDRAGQTAPARHVVFPRFVRGSETNLQPISKGRALIHLAEHSFNYDVLGVDAFDLLSKLIEDCHCYELRYDNLDEATACIDGLLERRRSQHTAAVYA